MMFQMLKRNALTWVINIFMAKNKEGSIECKYCGTKNKKGRAYCWKCGKPLIPIVYQDN